MTLLDLSFFYVYRLKTLSNILIIIDIIFVLSDQKTLQNSKLDIIRRYNFHLYWLKILTT